MHKISLHIRKHNALGKKRIYLKLEQSNLVPLVDKIKANIEIRKKNYIISKNR